MWQCFKYFYKLQLEATFAVPFIVSLLRLDVGPFFRSASHENIFSSGFASGILLLLVLIRLCVSVSSSGYSINNALTSTATGRVCVGVKMIKDDALAAL